MPFFMKSHMIEQVQDVFISLLKSIFIKTIGSFLFVSSKYQTFFSKYLIIIEK